jgi:hypothetical protein
VDLSKNEIHQPTEKAQLPEPGAAPRGSTRADWLDEYWLSTPPVTADDQAPPDSGMDPEAAADMLRLEMLTEDIMSIGKPPPPPPDPRDAAPDRCGA